MFNLLKNIKFIKKLPQLNTNNIVIPRIMNLSIFTPDYSLQYTKVGFFFLISFLVCNLLILLSYILSLTTIKNAEKLSEYECGFEPFDNATRHPFDIHFYVVGILFLIFDVEIAMIFPWIIDINCVSWFGFYSMVFFLIVITIGFFYEWHRGALSWPQTLKRFKNSPKLTGHTEFMILSSLNNMTEDLLDDVLDELDPFVQFFYDDIETTWTEFVYLIPEIFIAIEILVILIYIGKIYLYQENITDKTKKKFTISMLKLIKSDLLFANFLILLLFIFSANNPLKFSENFSSNSYILIVQALILACGYFVINKSILYITLHFRLCYEFSFLVLSTIFFLLLFVASANLISLFLCLVGFSLCTYILIMFDSPSPTSVQASVKYFYLSALSSSLIGLGLVFIFIWLLKSNFTDLRYLINNQIIISQHFYELDLGIVGILAIIYGFLFKLSAFPCHFWVAEIYEGSPTPVMAIFILPIKLAVMATFINLLNVLFENFFITWNFVLWFSCFMSMVWGCLTAYNENKIRKFIAYSSVNQMGFLLIGITVNTFLSVAATLNYLFIYILLNWAFLTMYLAIFDTRTATNIKNLTDFKHRTAILSPISLFSFFGICVILFSMAGIPPLAGFFGKFILFLAACISKYYFLVLIGLITSLISAFYYCRIINITYFDAMLKTAVSTSVTSKTNFKFDATNDTKSETTKLAVSMKQDILQNPIMIYNFNDNIWWLIALTLQILYLVFFIPVGKISLWITNVLFN